MNTESDLPLNDAGQTTSLTETPSIDFINAISEFFETDPSDLLVELGYYKREDDILGPTE